MSARIHFAGIGGVGMAALAVLEKARGAEVSGCDIHPSPRTLWLESLGIPVFSGHSARHAEGVDALVVTGAVDPSNPEILAARERNIPTVKRGEALARIVSSRESIAVCGSHGKTTTSTYIARLLKALGEEVSWAIGGETGSFPVAGACEGFAQGKGVLVVEADESDGTLALYHAATLVVTNCEWDHPDHFKTFGEYKACFDKARAQARDVVEAESLSPAAYFPDIPEHNRKNAAAAVEVALRRGHRLEDIIEKLRPIVVELPDRRFQTIVSQSPRGTVVADYAHHPTEMKCAVGMAREACKGRLRVLFQPHRYSRTKALLENFPQAFTGADEVVLCPVYAAFEKPLEGGGSASLYAACRRAGLHVMLARSCEEAWRHAFLEAGEDDLTLLLGAGDIINLAARVSADCALPAKPVAQYAQLAGFSFFRTGGRSCGGGAKRVCGAGSNTWISDLTTDEEYVRLPAGGEPEEIRPGIFRAPAGIPGAKLGIPWMAGIPGTVGGWIKMNAGAFGHSVSEAVLRVKVDGRWIEVGDCGFGYRTSRIEGMVEEIEFSRVEGDASQYLARRLKFPPGCCGSVFRNPPGDFAGKLLEEAGVKGMSVGGAYVWEGHANVVVAGDGAVSSDILALVKLMREAVSSRTGICLVPEISGLEL